MHHAHLFASDLEQSINFYREMFGAEVLGDFTAAGARNVLLRIGTAHINFYQQPPRDAGRGAVHHLGIRTHDLEQLVAHMKSKGFQFRKEITETGPLKYVMAEGPDGVLLELFQARFAFEQPTKSSQRRGIRQELPRRLALPFTPPRPWRPSGGRSKKGTRVDTVRGFPPSKLNS